MPRAITWAITHHVFISIQNAASNLQHEDIARMIGVTLSDSGQSTSGPSSHAMAEKNLALRGAGGSRLSQFFPGASQSSTSRDDGNSDVRRQPHGYQHGHYDMARGQQNQFNAMSVLGIGNRSSAKAPQTDLIRLLESGGGNRSVSSNGSSNGGTSTMPKNALTAEVLERQLLGRKQPGDSVSAYAFSLELVSYSHASATTRRRATTST